MLNQLDTCFSILKIKDRALGILGGYCGIPEITLYLVSLTSSENLFNLSCFKKKFFKIEFKRRRGDRKRE